MVLKSLQIGALALFLDEKVFTLHNVFRACHIQQLITPEVFCDRSKLFAVLKW